MVGTIYYTHGLQDYSKKSIKTTPFSKKNKFFSCNLSKYVTFTNEKTHLYTKHMAKKKAVYLKVPLHHADVSEGGFGDYRVFRVTDNGILVIDTEKKSIKKTKHINTGDTGASPLPCTKEFFEEKRAGVLSHLKSM